MEGDFNRYIAADEQLEGFFEGIEEVAEGLEVVIGTGGLAAAAVGVGAAAYFTGEAIMSGYDNQRQLRSSGSVAGPRSGPGVYMGKNRKIQAKGGTVAQGSILSDQVVCSKHTLGRGRASVKSLNSEEYSHVISRFGALNAYETTGATFGFYPLAPAVGTSAQASTVTVLGNSASFNYTVVALPMYAFPLSPNPWCIGATKAGVSTDGAAAVYGAFQLVKVAVAGTTTTNLEATSFYMWQPVDSSHGVKANCDIEHVSHACRLQEKYIHDWSEIKLLLHGATAAPSTVHCEIVSFTNKSAQPPRIYKPGVSTGAIAAKDVYNATEGSTAICNKDGQVNSTSGQSMDNTYYPRFSGIVAGGQLDVSGGSIYGMAGGNLSPHVLNTQLRWEAFWSHKLGHPLVDTVIRRKLPGLWKTKKKFVHTFSAKTGGGVDQLYQVPYQKCLDIKYRAGKVFDTRDMSTNYSIVKDSVVSAGGVNDYPAVVNEGEGLASGYGASMILTNTLPTASPFGRNMSHDDYLLVYACAPQEGLNSAVVSANTLPIYAATTPANIIHGYSAAISTKAPSFDIVIRNRHTMKA